MLASSVYLSTPKSQKEAPPLQNCGNSRWGVQSPAASRYWYARRHYLRERTPTVPDRGWTPPWLRRVATGKRKTEPSGELYCGTARAWSFRTNLLRKRAAYDDFFKSQLGAVSHSLLRVATRRTLVAGVQTQVQGTDEDGRGGPIRVEAVKKLAKPQVSSMAIAAVKELRKESTGKWKEDLQKYTRRTVERVSRKKFRATDRLITWEARQLARERRVRERIWEIQMRSAESWWGQKSSGYRLGRGKALRHIPILDSRGELLNVVTFEGDSSTGNPSPPFYFDENGYRVLFGSRRSVLG